jgi:mannitol-1-phosphate 5-dehydrogenase
VNFFDMGANSVASLIAEGLKTSKSSGTIIYTAENNNHAAEILQEVVEKKIGKVDVKKAQFLNTVIGKMSQVVTDAAEVAKLKIKPMAPGIERAFLVEAFNKILVTRTNLPGFKPGIEVFIEKDDLLPFEEAKLYGHNAIHALLAYLGAAKGYTKMTELKDDSGIMKIGREAFLKESGGALMKKYAKLGDNLFTEAGYKEYAEDLLTRMTNPFLTDTIDRAGRDPVRKLGFSDRIFGTMRLALEYGIKPVNMALGAAAGLGVLMAKADENKLPEGLKAGQIEKVIDWLWQGKTDRFNSEIIGLVQEAKGKLLNS